MNEETSAREEEATVAWPIGAMGQESPGGSARQFGSIRLIRRVGRGGMGEVWLGRHEILGRDVAIKILSMQAGGPADPAVAGFIQGAKVAASRGHPGLNRVFHADVVEGFPYLVLEFLDGPNLRDVLARSGRLPPSIARTVIETVAEAVAELHHHDLVHRDLKPSNIVLTRDGRIVVTDFGLACMTPAAALRGGAGGVAGTPAYMAPEMFDGVVSARTDVYAIGMTAYHLLSGQPAFRGTPDELRAQHQHVAIDVEPLRAADVPEGLIEVVVRATSKQILFRPKSARHALEAFRAAFRDAGINRALPESIAQHIREHPASPQARPHAQEPSTSSMEQTLAQFAARKREHRSDISLHHPAASDASHVVDPAQAKRRRAERRRIWLAYLVATPIGGCAAIVTVLFVMRHWWMWEHWVEVDLAHTSGIRRTAPAFSSAGVSPLWARLLVMLGPVGAFVIVPVCVSVFLYRMIRRVPLPPDTESTRCGWCQHELRGIQTPVCAECGHRIGDRGPDEQGMVPLGRRWPRRFAAWSLLPMAFAIFTFIAAMVVSLVVRVVVGQFGVVGIGGGVYNVIPLAVFPGLAMTLAFYEGFLQFDIRYSGRAWCRFCKSELRDLLEPVCPQCGRRI